MMASRLRQVVLRTKHCQPAMYIGGLAAFELLKKDAEWWMKGGVPTGRVVLSKQKSEFA